MLIKADSHTVGSTVRWRVKYAKWLENTAYITSSSTVVSDNASYVVSGVQVVGKDLVFLVSGGELNVSATLTVTMVDSLGNILIDTLNLTGVAP